MTISALNPVLAAVMSGINKNSAAAGTSSDETPAAATAQTAPDAALTGNTSGQMSTDNKTILLSYQEDQPTISLKSIRQTLFERYDADKNGTIDDTEWQQYLDLAHKPLDNGQPLDFRNYDPASDSKQITPTKVDLDAITTHVDA